MILINFIIGFCTGYFGSGLIIKGKNENNGAKVFFGLVIFVSWLTYLVILFNLKSNQ